ncbi:MAG: YidH family protein [Sphingomicrobium sp.]
MEQPAAPQTEELKKQTAEIKRSTKAVERQTGELTDSAERRTQFASDRTMLAAERTYAAWVRTALAALAGGIGARALGKDILPEWVGKVTGSVLVIFAGFCLVAAVWRELHGLPKDPEPDFHPVPRSMLIPMNFFLLLVTAAALVGIWAS